MTEVVKLVTPKDVQQEVRDGYIDGAIEHLKEFRNEGSVDGMCIVVIFKGGGNWSSCIPLEDTLKMVGAIRMMEHDTLQEYREKNK